MKKRIFSFVLTFCLILTICPGQFSVNVKSADSNTLDESYQNRIANHELYRAFFREYVDPNRFNTLDAVDQFYRTYTDEQLAEIKAKVLEVTAGCHTPREKMKAIYDYVTENVYYAINCSYSVQIYDVFSGSPTVCTGYAKLTQIMLLLSGIPCVCIAGKLHEFNAAYDSTAKNWIYMDTTWGSGKKCENGVKIYNPHTDIHFDYSASFIAKDITGSHDPAAALDCNKNFLLINGLYYNISTKNINEKNGLSFLVDGYTDQKDVYIPESITLKLNGSYYSFETAIDLAAFQYDSTMETLHLPADISLSEKSFYCCTRLTSVIFYEVNRPSTHICSYAKYAFVGCHSLKKITLPSNLQHLYDNVFAFDHQPPDVIFTGDYPDIPSGPTVNNDGITENKKIFCQDINLLNDYAKVYYPIENRTWTSEVLANLNDYYNYTDWIGYYTTIKDISKYSITSYPDGSVSVLNGPYRLNSGTDFTYIHVDENGNEITDLSIPHHTIITGIGDYTGSYECHTWDDGVPVKGHEACCISDGQREYTCKLCSAKKITREFRNRTHLFGEGVVAQTPSTTRPGSIVYTCTKCGTKEEKLIPNLISVGSCTASFTKAVLYDGTEKKPSVTLKYGSKQLIMGTDYTIQYSLNTKVGSARITIYGKGIYGGSKEFDFHICKDLTKMSFEAIAPQLYTGLSIKPAVRIKDGNAILSNNRDYTVSYSNNISLGTGKITITGIGDYMGTKELTFPIVSDNTIAPGWYNLRIYNCYYMCINSDGKTIIKKNNKNDAFYVYSIGKTKFVIKTQNGKYLATTTATRSQVFEQSTPFYWTLTKQGDSLFSLNPYGKTTTFFNVSGDKAEENREIITYKYSSSNPTNNCKFRFIPVSNVCEHTNSDWEVTKKASLSTNGLLSRICTSCQQKQTETIPKITSCSLNVTSFVYSGSKKIPSVTIKDSSGKTLKINKDYSVEYSKDCKSIGTHSATITFKGFYFGKTTLKFTIIPKATSLSKVSATKKGFNANWKKQTNQTSGYQLQYATTSGFRNGVKTLFIKKTSTTSKAVSSLISSKKYYIRVRTYKTKGGIKYYSKWSKNKKVVVK